MLASVLASGLRLGKQIIPLTHLMRISATTALLLSACIARHLVWTCAVSGCLSGEESCLVVLLHLAELFVARDLFWMPALCSGSGAHMFIAPLCMQDVVGWWSMLCYAFVY